MLFSGSWYWWFSFEVWGPFLLRRKRPQWSLLAASHWTNTALPNLLLIQWMGGKGGFAFLFVQTFLVNSILSKSYESHDIIYTKTRVCYQQSSWHADIPINHWVTEHCWLQRHLFIHQNSCSFSMQRHCTGSNWVHRQRTHKLINNTIYKCLRIDTCVVERWESLLSRYLITTNHSKDQLQHPLINQQT